MLQNHLEKLKGFRAIAEHGSILKASQMIGISQPALTKSLRLLEDAVGTKLFVRHQRGITLTEGGIELSIFCDRLFQDLLDVEMKVKIPNKISGVIQVGSYETLGISFWPKVLKELKQRHPSLRIQITTENPNTIWQRLDNGSLHLIVDAEPPLHEKYFSKSLYTDKFGLYCSPRFTSLEGALPVSYVKRAFDHEKRTIQEHLRKRHVDHDLLFDFDSFTSVRAVTLEEMAVGVMPTSLVQEELDKGKLKPFLVDGAPLYFGEHKVCVTCLEERRKDPRLAEVIKVLKTNN